MSLGLCYYGTNIMMQHPHMQCLHVDPFGDGMYFHSWIFTEALQHVFHGLVTLSFCGKMFGTRKDPCKILLYTYSHLQNKKIFRGRDTLRINNLNRTFICLCLCQGRTCNSESKIELVVIDPMTCDDWILCWDDVAFKARKFYNLFFKELNPSRHITRVWKTKCMMKHKVFAWLMFISPWIESTPETCYAGDNLAFV